MPDTSFRDDVVAGVFAYGDGFVHVDRAKNGLEGVIAKPIVVFPDGTVDYFDSAIIAGVADGVAKRIEANPQSNQKVAEMACLLLEKHTNSIGDVIMDTLKDTLRYQVQRLALGEVIDKSLPVSARLRVFAETMPADGYRRDVERLASLAEREGR